MHAQSSKLLCHSIEQTIRAQREFQKANLVMLGENKEEQKQSSSTLYSETERFFKEPPEDKDDALK